MLVSESAHTWRGKWRELCFCIFWWREGYESNWTRWVGGRGGSYIDTKILKLRSRDLKPVALKLTLLNIYEYETNAKTRMSMPWGLEHYPARYSIVAGLFEKISRLGHRVKSSKKVAVPASSKQTVLPSIKLLRDVKKIFNPQYWWHQSWPYRCEHSWRSLLNEL